ncbi:hypothetical protein DFQ28_006308 [Apophysomyces sp. BC1034]|nr:hypothetical protein DFQ28_006308 [Apophysomyces sp. BC1034]
MTNLVSSLVHVVSQHGHQPTLIACTASDVALACSGHAASALTHKNAQADTGKHKITLVEEMNVLDHQLRLQMDDLWEHVHQLLRLMQQWRHDTNHLETSAWQEIHLFISMAREAVAQQDYGRTKKYAHTLASDRDNLDSCHRTGIAWHVLQSNLSTRQILSQKPLSAKKRLAILKFEGDWLVTYTKIVSLACLTRDLSLTSPDHSKETENLLQESWSSLLHNIPHNTLFASLGRELIPSTIVFVPNLITYDDLPQPVMSSLMSFSWYKDDLQENDRGHVTKILVERVMRQPSEAIPILLEHIKQRDGSAMAPSLSILSDMVDLAAGRLEIMQPSYHRRSVKTSGEQRPSMRNTYQMDAYPTYVRRQRYVND